MLMGWWRVKISSGCPRRGRLAAASSLSSRSTSHHTRRSRFTKPCWRQAAPVAGD
jgi:hypothetical protein